MANIIYIKPPQLILDYGRNVASTTDARIAKLEVQKRVDENVALRESLEADRVNQVAVDVVKVGDDYLTIEGFCRGTILTDLYDDGIDCDVKCEVHDIDPNDKVAFWLIQMKNDSRTSKSPIARATTAKRCYDELRLNEPNLRQCDIAKRLGISTGMLSNYLAVAGDTTAVDLIRNGHVEFTTAQSILKATKESGRSVIDIYQHAVAMKEHSRITQTDVQAVLDDWLTTKVVEDKVDVVEVELDNFDVTGMDTIDTIHESVDNLVSQHPLEAKKFDFVKQYAVDDVNILQTLDQFVQYASNL